MIWKKIRKLFNKNFEAEKEIKELLKTLKFVKKVKIIKFYQVNTYIDSNSFNDRKTLSEKELQILKEFPKLNLDFRTHFE